MIQKLLPLTKNKINLLKEIYEREETHLLELSKIMKIHPYSLKKTLDSLKPLMNEKKAGKTIRISINKNLNSYMMLAVIIEDYKKESVSSEVMSIVKTLENVFFIDNVKSLVLFGSYARGTFNDKSDIDILFVVKIKSTELKEKISHFSSIIGKEVNPIILNEKELEYAIKKDVAISSLKKPSQRIIIKGAETFLDITEKA